MNAKECDDDTDAHSRLDRFLDATLRFDHGNQVSTAQGAQECPLPVERSTQHFRPCTGRRRCVSGPGYVLLCGHPSRRSGLHRAGVDLRWRLSAIGQAMKGRRVGQLSQSVLKAVERLDDVRSIDRRHMRRANRSPIFAELWQRSEVLRQVRKMNTISRRLHAKGDEEAITAWRLDPDETHRGFEVRSLASS